MTQQPSTYEIVRAIQEQQRATDRLIGVLLGILDKSAPDPFVDWNPPGPAQEPSARVVAAEAVQEPRRTGEPTAKTKRERRQSGDAERAAAKAATSKKAGGNTRPAETIPVAGRDFQTTALRARIIRAVQLQPRALGSLCEMGIGRRVDALRKQIADLNSELTSAGIPARIAPIENIRRSGVRGGSVAARFGLIISDGLPDTSPAAQNEAAVGQSPEQAADECVLGRAGSHRTQSDEFVTLVGAEEGGLGDPGELAPAPAADALISEPSSALPPCAAEARPPAGKDSTASQPAALRPSANLPLIEPGDLLAVDVKHRQIVTGKGAYVVAGASLARALDKMKSGQLFGFDVIAKVAGWPTPYVAQTALSFERGRLAEHGIELWTDKFNARLRVPA